MAHQPKPGHALISNVITVVLAAGLCSTASAIDHPQRPQHPAHPLRPTGPQHAAHAAHPTRSASTTRLIVRARAGLHPSLRAATLNQQGAQEVASIDALGAAIVEVSSDRADATQNGLRATGYFKSVEPDYAASATQTPDDPAFSTEWGVLKIGAPAVWNVTLGSPDLIIAIVDSGVDPTHPDLQRQLVEGYDFVNNDADPADDNGHGTRMAGIVAAESSNGIGIAGVAPGCKLMPVKVLGRDANGSYSAIANGITYATDHGARIINLSVAGSQPSDLLQSAVDYASARGVVVVASSGNEGTGRPAYPAAYANAVAVGATDASDRIARFSNYGSWLGLAAPGVDIATTNWTGSGSAYATSTGTSPAAAFVSGAFALLLSAQPEISNAAAIALMTTTARDLNSRGWDPFSGWGRVDIANAIGARTTTTTTAPPTTSSSTQTVASRDRTAPSVNITAPANNGVVSSLVQVDVTATDDVGVTAVELAVDGLAVARDAAPPFSFIWDSTTVAPGRHALSANAYDAAGHRKMSKAIRLQIKR